MLQGVEVYKGKPLFYSLGNFAFDKKHPWFHPATVIVRCQITAKRISQVSVLPCLIDEHEVPRLLEPEASGVVVRRLEEDSTQFGTRFEPSGDAVAISA
jgi:poly-gamma-glutamate synthesis protein (capsule biosynthesis protein)